MAWHSLDASAPKQEVDPFEAKALASTGLDVTHVPPRYRSSYFAHIWGSGYAAGYYAYIWTDMLQQNVYDWFESHGGMTRANGQRFRELVLSKGHSQPYSVMFHNMTGHDPEVGPLLGQNEWSASGRRRDRGRLATRQNGRGRPSASRKPPLSARVSRAAVSTSRRAATAGVCNRSAGTPRWKGRLSGVSTVPGWRAAQMACGCVRASSTAIVRTIMFSAAFDAR